MITDRNRGLVRIHGWAVILAISVLFWGYAELTIRFWSSWMRLSREVNLPGYFLCVLVGLLLGGGRVRELQAKLTRLDGIQAAGLATTQVALIALAVFSMMFATQDRSISRLFLGTFLVWSWLALVGLHLWLPRFLARQFFGSAERIPTLFIGRAEAFPRLQSWLEERQHLGMEPAGWVEMGEETPQAGDQTGQKRPETGNLKPEERPSAWNPRPDTKRESGNLADVAGLLAGVDVPAPTQVSGVSSQVSGRPTGFRFQVSGLDQLPQVLQQQAIGQVVLMEMPASAATARRILSACQAQGCRLLILHQVDEILGHRVASVEEGGRHFFALHAEPLEEPINRALKRGFDLLVAIPAALLVLPLLMAGVWIVQRFQSPGPLFHVRPRSGERRVQFRMLKFRTMHVAPADAVAERQQASASDERVYPFGRFLRRHSLDEFPQFWNVLTGEMSVVGPRPVMPLLDEEFERQVRAYRSKHWVKPGITGLAQSTGFRGEITSPELLQERIRLDLHYISHWSIWLDVVITVRTAWQVVKPPPAAY